MLYNWGFSEGNNVKSQFQLYGESKTFQHIRGTSAFTCVETYGYSYTYKDHCFYRNKTKTNGHLFLLARKKKAVQAQKFHQSFSSGLMWVLREQFLPRMWARLTDSMAKLTRNGPFWTISLTRLSCFREVHGLYLGRETSYLTFSCQIHCT
jgi:hypothetical protein